jgi:hypothetical protein
VSSKILLIAMALALPAVLCAETVNLVATVTSTVNTVDDYLVFVACTAAPPGCTVALPVQIDNGNLAPAGTYPVQESVTSGVPITSGLLTVIGLDASNLNEVVVGLCCSSFVGNPWPFDTGPFGTAESTIASDLQNSSALALAGFFQNNLSGDVPETPSFWLSYAAGTTTNGNLVAFSNGTPVGTLSAALTAPTPEPATFGITSFLLAGGFFYRVYIRTKRSL